MFKLNSRRWVEVEARSERAGAGVGVGGVSVGGGVSVAGAVEVDVDVALEPDDPAGVVGEALALPADRSELGRAEGHAGGEQTTMALGIFVLV